MLKIFQFSKGTDPFACLPRSARKNIKGDEMLLVISTTKNFVIVDDNNGAGNKYCIPRSAGEITKLQISL